MIPLLFLTTEEDFINFETSMANSASGAVGKKILKARLTRNATVNCLVYLVLTVPSTKVVDIFQHTRCAIMITFDIFALRKLFDCFYYVFNFQKRGETKITCRTSVLTGNGAIAKIHGCVTAQE